MSVIDSPQRYEGKAGEVLQEAVGAFTLAQTYTMTVAEHETGVPTEDQGTSPSYLEPLLDDDLTAYEDALADQLEQAAASLDEALHAESVYDRDRGEIFMVDGEDQETFYTKLDEAYIALCSVIDALSYTAEQTNRPDIIDDVSLPRDDLELDSSDFPAADYHRHLEAFGLDDL